MSETKKNNTNQTEKLVYIHAAGGQFRWITVSILLLALGTILHMVSPSIAGVTPDWLIATYCVAINLTRPTYKQAIGIGFVASLLSLMTSKSAFPYGNLLSEPAGALLCAFIVHEIGSLRIGSYNIKPILTGFFGTVASGGTFITILYFALGLPFSVYVQAMWPLVLVVAFLNGVITPLIYVPAQRLFAKRGFLQSDMIESTNHKGLHITPRCEGVISIEELTYYYNPLAASNEVAPSSEANSSRTMAQLTDSSDVAQPALKNIQLTIQKGEFVVVTGPAGCGKSTLCLAMVGGVPKFYGGRMEGMVFVEGRAITQQSIGELAEKIGVVLADYDSQLVTMTVQEEVAFAMQNRGYEKVRILEETKQLLAQVGLEGLESRAVTSLSGGQRQRLAIASVLATNPSILVLDEPTSSLDPEGTAELYQLIGRLNREAGLTVVVIDHELQAAIPYAHRLVLMEAGRILCDDTVEATLQYMYEHNRYKEAIPTMFVAYMELRQAGYSVGKPWLHETQAEQGIKQALGIDREEGHHVNC